MSTSETYVVQAQLRSNYYHEHTLFQQSGICIAAICGSRDSSALRNRNAKTINTFLETIILLQKKDDIRVQIWDTTPPTSGKPLSRIELADGTTLYGRRCLWYVDKQHEIHLSNSHITTTVTEFLRSYCKQDNLLITVIDITGTFQQPQQMTTFRAQRMS